MMIPKFLELKMGNGLKTAFRISEIAALGERLDGTVDVYLKGDPDPFVSGETYTHVMGLLFEYKTEEERG